jgi:LuxR family maltose regulon positive regulatory protein
MLLSTKFHVPSIRPTLISHPHLIQRMKDGVSGKLILVSAPAGFGKSTLVAEWVNNGLPKAYQGRVAWLSLNENDNELAQFFTYFIAALQQINPEIGIDSKSILEGPQPPPIEILLTMLVNEIANAEENFVLVLDDYHVITHLPIDNALGFLLNHMPSNLCLVIISRDEPFLPLSRLRARGRMVEVRTEDLRFSLREANEYLNQIMHLSLSDDDVNALTVRTEGWIVGLHLAALSLQNHNDPSRFVTTFTGNDRYIIDYLVDEVLAYCSDEIRWFLLSTSILDRMTSPVCNAITQQTNGQETLQQLERSNVFTIPLDNQRLWYRYHHLFADVLRQRLVESTSPERIKTLHQHASSWFIENNYLIEAVEHALAAKDYDTVVHLICTNAADMFLQSQLKTLLKWQQALPPKLVESQPRLCLIFSWAWVATGHPENAEPFLRSIESVLEVSVDEWLFDSNQDETISAPTRGALLEVATLRAQLAMSRGDIPEAIELTRKILPHLEDNAGPYLHNPPVESQMVASFILGLAQKMQGNLSAAEKYLTQANELSRRQKHIHILALSFGHLAGVQAVRGELNQALKTCESGIQAIEKMAGPRSPLSGLLQAELGNLLYERNNLKMAQVHLEQAVAVGRTWQFTEAIMPGLIGLTRIQAAQENWHDALMTLDELESLDQGSLPLVKSAVDSCRVWLWIMRGDANSARQWIVPVNLEVPIEVSFDHEDSSIVYMQWLTATCKWTEAARLLERFIEAAEASERWGQALKLWILQSVLFQGQGKGNEAIRSLERALLFAEPQGYFRVFVDMGKEAAVLLQKIASSNSEGSRYAKKVLSAFTMKTPSSDTELIESLSERELEVLRLLKTEMTGPEIAAELVIALSTLRTHTQQIYRKLGVNNRLGAVHKAAEIHID